MTLITELPPDRLRTGRPVTGRWVDPARRQEAPAMVVNTGAVVALRQRSVVALGALSTRDPLPGPALTVAHDLSGATWWIAADAVWSDVNGAARPEHPRPVGLVAGRHEAQALVKGISDRLGWEAVLAFEHGAELPSAVPFLNHAPANLIALDGRLGHEVPTVVLLGEDMVRWGAGATWDAALHRALLGDGPGTAADRELDTLVSLLAASGIEIGRVDLGSDLLRRAGVVRFSVQLLNARDVPVRRWDGVELK